MPRPNKYDLMYPGPRETPPTPLEHEVKWPPPQAPADLTAAQRKHFDEIVSGNPHLTDMLHTSVLCSYIRLYEDEQKLSARVAKEGAVYNHKLTAVYKAWVQTHKIMLSYIRLMKLGPLYRKDKGPPPRRWGN
jgi:hypothetical protein